MRHFQSSFVLISLGALTGLASSSVPAHAYSTGSAQHAALALPFIEDDYSQALTQARARKLPIFIESWAPW